MGIPGGLDDELRDAAFELDALVARSGLSGQFTSGYRSHSEQERLYRAYISGRHRFPVAPPGSSAHEYGWAFDYVVTPTDYQPDVGRVWQSWGGVWGGRRDYVHFELPGASEAAAQLGKSFAEEIVQKYNDIPWWISLLLPQGTTLQEARSRTSVAIGEASSNILCRAAGIFC